MRILLVEDDDLLGRATLGGLQQDGYTVDWVQEGGQGLTAALTHDYALVLLDLGLPGIDGMSVLSHIRQKGVSTPVIIMTARGEVGDRIKGLDEGADDFIVKPFDLDELSARIRASIRRAQGRAQPIITFGNIVVEPASRRVSKAGETVHLTAREFSMLLSLMETPGQVKSRSQLEESLYGWGEEVESNSIEVHIHHLRKKLGRELIRTVHGVGYRMQLPFGAMNGASEHPGEQGLA